MITTYCKLFSLLTAKYISIKDVYPVTFLLCHIPPTTNSMNLIPIDTSAVDVDL